MLCSGLHGKICASCKGVGATTSWSPRDWENQKPQSIGMHRVTNEALFLHVFVSQLLYSLLQKFRSAMNCVLIPVVWVTRGYFRPLNVFVQNHFDILWWIWWHSGTWIWTRLMRSHTAAITFVFAFEPKKLGHGDGNHGNHGDLAPCFARGFPSSIRLHLP